jgi:hypothetical protein
MDMGASASPTDLHPPPVDAGGGSANPIELDAAPLLSLAPAASSVTFTSLTEAQPAQAHVSGPVALDADVFPTRWYEPEPAARLREGAREKGTSTVWCLAYRLTKIYFVENNVEMGGAAVATHVCRAPLVNSDGEPLPGAFCNHLLVLCRQKIDGKDKVGPYITSKVITHCSRRHQGTEVAAAAAAKAKTLAFTRQNTLLAGGGGQAGASSSKLLVQGKLGGMVLNFNQKALCAQVRWFVYCKQKISKSMFNDKAFRDMLQCNDTPGEPTPILSFKMIDKWVSAEYQIFLLFFRHALALKREQAKGNAFAQAQHDGGTLKNHKKVQVQALQWMDPSQNRNHVVVFALSSLAAIEVVSSPTTDQEDDFEGLSLDQPQMLIPEAAAHTDANVAKDYTLNLEKATGLKFMEVVATSIQDGAAGGVAGHLALCLSREQEICNMHAASKIGAAALGFLTRSRMKKVIDPYPHGKKVCARLLAVAKAFSHTKAREALAGIAATLADVSTTAQMPPRAVRPRGSARARMCLRSRMG